MNDNKTVSSKITNVCAIVVIVLLAVIIELGRFSFGKIFVTYGADLKAFSSFILSIPPFITILVYLSVITALIVKEYKIVNVSTKNAINISAIILSIILFGIYVNSVFWPMFKLGNSATMIGQ